MKKTFVWGIGLSLAAVAVVTAQTAGPVRFVATELLGRPTDTSVTVNVVADSELEAYFEYGGSPGVYTEQTLTGTYPGGEPIEVVIDQLRANARYYYRMRYRRPGEIEFRARDEHWFHTRRSPGSTFTFTIQADSHLGTPNHCDPDLYRRTLHNARGDSPDFHIDLGDTFRATHLKTVNYREIEKLHLAQREFFGIVCHSAPLFVALGNHEEEVGWELDGTPDNVPVWATTSRKIYYPNPVPDDFYTGSETVEPFVGLRENYYAWEWGDALFIVLDPYWYIARNPKESKDSWDWTFGDEQYRWLQRTLESSQARFKFVFSHHVNGEARGGIELADLFEWGGRKWTASTPTARE